MDGLFVVKNCWTSASELIVAGKTKLVEAEETLVHKGAGDGGTPLPRTHGATEVETSFAVPPFIPQFVPQFIPQFIPQFVPQFIPPFVPPPFPHQTQATDPGNL